MAPTLVLTIMNGAIVPIIKKLVELEKWDFSYQTLNQTIWRIWVGKMINLLIFVSV